MGINSPIVTDAGAAAIAAARVGGHTISYKSLAVGDANGVSYAPTSTQTALVNEVWRGDVESVSLHENNKSWVVVQARIPSTDGGFDIREAAIYDSNDVMIAVCRYPLTTKPAPSSGSEKDLLVRFIFEVTNAGEVTLMIDPSIIYASEEYVDARLHHVRLATTANITLSGTQTIDGIAAVAGDRVLVKNQSTATNNGIYVVASGTWARALDFDDVNNILPTALVTVSEGTLYKDSLWMLTNDSITLGTTSLAFTCLFPDESMRTLVDTTAPTGNTGTPTTLFGWLANMIKQITGKSSWRTAPAITLEATKGHVDAANPHTDSAPIAYPTFTGKVQFTNATAAIRKGNDGELILECTKPFIYNGTAYTNIWHAGNDGAGSGLDADTLDGVEGTGYARTWHVGRHDNGIGWMKLCSINTGLPQGNKLTFLLSGAVGSYGAGTEATGHAQVDLTLANDNTWVGTLYKIAFTTALLGVAIVPGTGSAADVWINTPSYVDISALMFGNNLNYITPAADTWTSTNPGGVVCNAYTIWTSGNDGTGSGMDADMVDGYHVLSGVRPTSGLVKVGDYGVTGNATPMGSIDLNTLTAQGFYYGSYTAHSPTGSTSTSFYIVNIANSATGYLLQCAWDTATTGKMYQRVCYNGTWTAWVQMAVTESPALTGTPTAPTPAASDNSSKIITSNWIYAAIGTVATAMGFRYSFGGNGYIQFPTWFFSLMLQWGHVDMTGPTVSAVWTFPTAFTSGWWYASAVQNVQGTNGYASITSAQGGLTNLTFGRSDTGTNTRTLFFAIGK